MNPNRQELWQSHGMSYGKIMDQKIEERYHGNDHLQIPLVSRS